jgi:uncharacterized protein
MAIRESQTSIPTTDPTATVRVTPEPALPVVADPAPLGLAGFAMTTFVLSVFNANLLTAGADVVIGLALAYGGIAQLLAGMWEFRKGNTFGALAFSSFGAFWLSFAVILRLPGIPPKAVGVYLLAWTIFTAYMTIAAIRTTLAVLAVFVFLTATFLFLTIGAMNNSTSATHVGGWLGLVTAVIAWYASFAGVVNATWQRRILPVVPLEPRAR